MYEPRGKVAQRHGPEEWQEDSTGALQSPACPAWAEPPGRPESWGSRRNGDGLRRGSGKPPGRRTVSRARPAPLTCGTHSIARLRGGSRHSATAPKRRHQAARRATPRGQAGKAPLPLWAVTSKGACAKRRPAGRGGEVARQECGRRRGWSAAECACVVAASGAPRILVDLLKLNVAPLAVFQMLKSMCAGQRLASEPQDPAAVSLPTSSVPETRGRNKGSAALGGALALAERSSREGSSQRMPRQPSATRLPKGGGPGKSPTRGST
ncbi:uncharacterized protein LOC100439961 isoform X1 [Pongo abelii]|uniref:uncharacterized protein LOC100439961 isoform X1 n=1 Tax=Pongo abelii TaxID=9601 RepID=UPI0023E7CF89|nr:mitotic-spindle organizing protein 2B isoform X1 [Pongo abelii]